MNVPQSTMIVDEKLEIDNTSVKRSYYFRGFCTDFTAPHFTVRSKNLDICIFQGKGALKFHHDVRGILCLKSEYRYRW